MGAKNQRQQFAFKPKWAYAVAATGCFSKIVLIAESKIKCNEALVRTVQPCRTSLPPGSSGTIQSYTAVQTNNALSEALWRGDKGYIRDVPLKNNGEVDWNSAPSWQHCCTSSGPAAAVAYIVGNHLFQNVFWSASNCEEYKTPLDDSGSPIWSSSTQQACRTSVPPGSSGTIETYTAIVTGEYLREALWRGGQGYIRDVALNSFNTDVEWSSAPNWQHCCTDTGPKAQGAFVLSHP